MTLKKPKTQISRGPVKAEHGEIRAGEKSARHHDCVLWEMTRAHNCCLSFLSEEILSFSVEVWCGRRLRRSVGCGGMLWFFKNGRKSHCSEKNAQESPEKFHDMSHGKDDSTKTFSREPTQELQWTRQAGSFCFLLSSTFAQSQQSIPRIR